MLLMLGGSAQQVWPAIQSQQGDGVFILFFALPAGWQANMADKYCISVPQLFEAVCSVTQHLRKRLDGILACLPIPALHSLYCAAGASACRQIQNQNRSLFWGLNIDSGISSDTWFCLSSSLCIFVLILQQTDKRGIGHFHFPVIVKPTDSSDRRGYKTGKPGCFWKEPLHGRTVTRVTSLVSNISKRGFLPLSEVIFCMGW